MNRVRISWKRSVQFWVNLYRKLWKDRFVLDVYGLGKYPADALSNFAEHHFVIDGVECRSMEGFLQSLKTENPICQQEICRLTGKRAKKRCTETAETRDWRKDGILFWQGREINRFAAEYQDLLNRAFDLLFENKAYREALKASGNRKLIHTVGKNDPCDTILTERELCDQLYRLRSKLI